MMLYVNGDSHTIGAEAVNQYITAGQDPKFAHLGKLPHPENLAVSWGKILSLSLKVAFCCGAYSDNNVDKIIDDTRKYIKEKGTYTLIIIQWPATDKDEDKIFSFHQELLQHNIKHIFFNSNQIFNSDKDWSNCFIKVPYENYIKDEKIETVSPNSKHFGRDGHSVWNRLLINYILAHKFI
ncbi:MAG: hypothetical protein EB127_08485 [Alphaproteobacteria bacterium]|nr:hypothetical protein [Alphaproteobacteria bacterium]